jgi:hypothetical protein
MAKDVLPTGPNQLWVADITTSPSRAASSIWQPCWMPGRVAWSATPSLSWRTRRPVSIDTYAAATPSLSKEPASYLATQMSTRLRLISWRLASPCRISPARYSCATWRLNAIG